MINELSRIRHHGVPGRSAGLTPAESFDRELSSAARFRFSESSQQRLQPNNLCFKRSDACGTVAVGTVKSEDPTRRAHGADDRNARHVFHWSREPQCNHLAAGIVCLLL